MPDTPIRKFMFDRSFDSAMATDMPVREKRPVPYTEEQIEAIREDARAAGFAAGRQATAEEQARLLNATMERIATQIGALLASAEAERPVREAALREAVLAVAWKVLPDFCKRNGVQEILAIVSRVIGEMASEPRLVVRIGESQFDNVNESVKALGEKHGYAGKIVLLADAALAPGDCRIEWADGGIERNVAALWQSLGNTLAPGQEIPSPPASPDTPL